jgi:hypothetical protein
MIQGRATGLIHISASRTIIIRSLVILDDQPIVGQLYTVSDSYTGRTLPCCQTRGHGTSLPTPSDTAPYQPDFTPRDWIADLNTTVLTATNLCTLILWYLMQQIVEIFLMSAFFVVTLTNTCPDSENVCLAAVEYFSVRQCKYKYQLPKWSKQPNVRMHCYRQLHMGRMSCH